VKLGVSVTEANPKGKSALILALKNNMPAKFVDLLINEGYAQKRWKGEHEKRFCEVVDEIRCNMDFGSAYIQDFLEAHNHQPLDLVKEELLKTPIHGPRPSLHHTPSWLVNLSKRSAGSPPLVVIYQKLKEHAVTQ
jgi:hypothetical protein